MIQLRHQHILAANGGIALTPGEIHLAQDGLQQPNAERAGSFAVGIGPRDRLLPNFFLPGLERLPRRQPGA